MSTNPIQIVPGANEDVGHLIEGGHESPQGPVIGEDNLIWLETSEEQQGQDRRQQQRQ